MAVTVCISSLTTYILAEQSTLYQIIKNDIVHTTLSCKGEWQWDLWTFSGRRFGYNSREPTRTTGSVGGTERGVQEARTENEPGEDRSDVGWTVRRSSKSMALCTLDERLRRMGIQR